MSPEQINEVIKRCQETGYLPNGTRHCLLCGDSCPDELMFVCLWIPEKRTQRRLGGSEKRLAHGGARTVLYLICPDCMERPTLSGDVEAEILKRGSVQ
jgi:hypothetical protein